VPGDRRGLQSLILLLALASSSGAARAEGNGPILTIEYPLPAGITTPSAITAGPNGNLWFIAGTTIGRITAQGSAVAIATIAGAIDLAAGADGNLWVTICEAGSGGAHAIARLTPAGDVTQFPTTVPGSCPQQITAGPDNRLWYTDTAADTVGRVSAIDGLTEFPLPPAAFAPQGITAGPDGNVWFTAQDRIGKINTSGTTIDTYPLSVTPAPRAPESIVTGPDGNLWFVEAGVDAIGRSNTSGSATEFFLPQAGNRARDITRGPDNNLWFTEEVAGKIGRITLEGTITEFELPTPGSAPFGIALGPDANLWFAESHANQIAKMLVTQTRHSFLPLLQR